MIKIENFSHNYGQLQVVCNLSLHIEPGDIYGFIGPNGAGKTTTIRFLATLLKPTYGSAFINEVDVAKSPHQVRQIIGYMPDDFGIYEGMKVREYLDFFAMAYGLEKQKSRTVEDVMEIVDLVDNKDAVANRLSRGMRQRLGLARALLHDPLVLLLDEPASGLDPRGRIEIMELLKELQKMGKTILVSSHILTELASYCNKIGIMEKGRLLAQGTLEEISQLLQKHKRIKLTILDKEFMTHQVLKKSREVMDIVQEEKQIFFDFSGSKADLSLLVAQLVKADIPVLYIEDVPLRLEDVFMRVTEGKLQ